MMRYSTKLLNYFRQRDRGWLLTLLVVACLVYLPFLGNPFFFDDLNFFSDAVLSHYAHSLFDFELRGLPYASLGWTAAIFSDAVPHFFHLGNALLHVGNVILLFYLLRQIAGAVVPEYEKSSAIVWGAWFGALVFACHPVAVYAVGYVVQRSILLATFFALVMQLAYVRGLLSGHKRWLVLAVVAYFMAGFSKEHSVMMPAVLAALTMLLRKKIQLDRRALWLGWGAFIAIAILLALKARGVLGAPYEAMSSTLFEQQGVVENTLMLHGLSAMTQAGLFFKYLLLWLLPNPAWMSVDMREPFIADWGMWQGWAGVLGFALYGLLGFGLLLRGSARGLVGMALLYPWLQFWVELSGIRVQEPFVLYRSYLWMPGLMLFFPLLLMKMPGRRTMLVLAGVVLLLVPLAWNRLLTFSNNYRLWNDAALLLPNERVAGADRIFYNRGQAEAAAHQWEPAAADFERAVAISPRLAPIRNELGKAYLNLAHYPEALAQFNAGIALQPDDGRLYFGKGLALMRQGLGEQAQQQMQKACELRNEVACMVAGWMQQKK